MSLANNDEFTSLPTFAGAIRQGVGEGKGDNSEWNVQSPEDVTDKKRKGR